MLDGDDDTEDNVDKVLGARLRSKDADEVCEYPDEAEEDAVEGCRYTA